MKQTDQTLPNGFRTVVIEDHFAPVVSIQIWISAGSADETPAQAGLAHVHEHMLFKGTPKRPVGAIAAQIEGAGGDINAFTSHDHTCYYVTMASRFFRTGLDVLSDAIRNPSFDGDELRREIPVILEEMARSNDTPMHKLSDAAFSRLYTHHPYGRPIIGTKKVLENLTRRDVLAFYRRHYRPSNMVLVIVGDVSTAAALKMVRNRFSDFSAPPYRPNKRTAQPPQKSFRSVLLFDPVHEATCSMLLPAPTLFGPDGPALDLLFMILGAGDSSRLYQHLWQSNALAHNTWASAYLPKDPGVLNIGFVTDPDRLLPALKAACEQLFALRTDPPSREEIEKVKRMSEAGFLYDLETYEGRARKTGYSICLSGSADLEEKFLERVLAVTGQDLLRVANQYLTCDRMTCALIAPTEFKGKIRAGDLRNVVKAAFEKAKATSSKPLTGPPDPPARSGVTVGTWAKRKRLVRITLDNGVRLLIAENPNVPVFAVRAAILGGRRLEPVAGLSNFTASLLC